MKLWKILLLAGLLGLMLAAMAHIWLNVRSCELNPFNADQVIACP
jgi:hypothetical protein